jgi:hypothetical protein
MDRLHELCATGSEVELEGRVYRLGSIARACDWAEIQKRIIEGRPDPLELVRPRLAGLPEAMARQLLELAYEDLKRVRSVTSDEIVDWMHTARGTVYCLWMALRDHHPEIALDSPLLERLRNSADPALWAMLQSKLDEASGLVDLKN